MTSTSTKPAAASGNSTSWAIAAAPSDRPPADTGSGATLHLSHRPYLDGLCPRCRAVVTSIRSPQPADQVHRRTWRREKASRAQPGLRHGAGRESACHRVVRCAAWIASALRSPSSSARPGDGCLTLAIWLPSLLLRRPGCQPGCCQGTASRQRMRPRVAAVAPAGSGSPSVRRQVFRPGPTARPLALANRTCDRV